MYQFKLCGLISGDCYEFRVKLIEVLYCFGDGCWFTVGVRVGLIGRKIGVFYLQICRVGREDFLFFFAIFLFYFYFVLVMNEGYWFSVFLIIKKISFSVYLVLWMLEERDGRNIFDDIMEFLDFLIMFQVFNFVRMYFFLSELVWVGLFVIYGGNF